MALPPVFPLFPDGLNGPYHVSLAFPGPQSEILKSAGVTASSLLLVPQADYLKKFVEGDLDIGDSVMKGMFAQNFASPVASENEEVFKKFAKLSKIEIDDINKYKKDGKFVMPTSEIKLSPEWENIGLSSIEKTTLKSIFETQKPYIEIAKLVLENLAYIEDIIARVMPLVSLNPFTCRSEKPNTNSGKDTRPKAMGFNNGDDLKKELSKIETLVNDLKPKQKLKLDMVVVDEYFKAAVTGEKQKRASQAERTLLSKYTMLIALFQRPENFFDFVYQKIVEAKGAETLYKSEIQKFLTEVSDTYKDLKIYQTSQPVDKVNLNNNDVIEIIKSAENKYNFRNNQNIPNITYFNIYKENALKFYREKVPFSMVPDESTEDPNSSATKDGNWKVINTIYSTGEFKPDVEYQFKYIDLPSDDPEFNEKKSDLDLKNIDPYHKYKPKKIIFGIYKSDGSPLNPTELVKTIGLDGTNVIQVNTPFQKADWVLRSPKWHLPTGVYQWPVYSEPFYVWEKGIQTRESKTNPDTAADPAWKIKKYKKGDKDLISGDDALPDNPVIARVERSEENEYRNFFNDFLKFKFHKSETLTKEDKVKSRKDIMDRLNVQSHVQNVFNYGQAKSSYYKPISAKDPIPSLLRKSFKPYQLFSTKASVDKELRDFAIAENLEQGFIWIEPEADYDMKVIRIDPVDKIKYFETKGEPELNTEIRDFVKNRFTIKFSNNMPFTIEVRKNANILNPTPNNPFALSEPEVYRNVKTYQLENWNYSQAKVFNDNLFDFTVYSSTPPPVYTNDTYKAKNAPDDKNLFYELKKVGDDYYYRKFKFKFDLEDIVIQTFIGWVAPNLLLALWIQYIAGEILEYTFTISELSYTINLDKIFPYREYSDFPKGDVILWTNEATGDGVWDKKYRRLVEVDGNGKITKWYYEKNRRFTGPSPKLPSGVVEKIDREVSSNIVLPTFGVVRDFVIDYNTETTNELKDNDISYSDQDFTLYKIKVNDNDPQGKIIDPSKITNQQLTNKELYGYGKDGLLSKYGHGSEEEPQELLTISRYRLTDLDTESYFIVEGTLRNPPPETEINVPDVAASAGQENNYYRLPDAIGAVKVFLSMLANVFAKLLPQIIKLISLFKNPMGFITDIITEKLQGSVSFLSKESLDTFKTGAKLKAELDEEKDVNEKKKKVRDMKKFYKSSPLSNYVFVKDDGKAVSILDGASLVPFGVFGLNLPFGMEMNLGGLLDKKVPLKLIFEKDLNLKNMKNLQKELNLKKIDKKPPSLKSSKPVNPNDTGDFQVRFEDGSERTVESGSFNQFTLDNKSRYNFVYLDENIGKTYQKIDEYIQKGTPEDLRRAKDLLDKAKKENPLDDSLLDKENLLKGKLEELQAGEQPLLKFILGIVTLPVKIIAGILEWIFNFFKSLINPLTLPTKIIELVSFKWVMQFFTPKGLLEIAGIRFKPEKKVEWAVQANIPGVPIPEIPNLKTPEIPEIGKFDIPNTEIPKFEPGNGDNKLNDLKKNATDLANNSKVPSDLKTGTGKVPSASDVKSGLGQVPSVDVKSVTGNLPSMSDIQNVGKPSVPSIGSLPTDASKLNLTKFKIPDLPKSLNLPEDIKLKGFDKKSIKMGDYLSGDDKKLADLSEFLNVGFHVKLPTYSAMQYRQNLKLPGPLLSAPGGGGFLCLIEKIINGIIDFVWATLGIEAIIPPPHVKLCDQKTPEEAAKIKDNTGATQSESLDGFYYEVVLENGETKKFLNQDDLQSFIDNNEKFNYDFNF
jgi:hypothetical protein